MFAAVCSDLRFNCPGNGQRVLENQAVAVIVQKVPARV